MTSYKPSICRGRKGGPGCGAEVRWVKNSKTLNPEILDAAPTAAGNIVIEGGLAVHLSAQRAREYDGAKYQSHFATCPHAQSFRGSKPHRAPSRPVDIPMGTFESPAAAAVGRIRADALDLTADRLTDEFCAYVHECLGNRPTEDELQHAWRDWHREKKNMGVEPETLALVASRARRRLVSAEVTAA